MSSRLQLFCLLLVGLSTACTTRPAEQRVMLPASLAITNVNVVDVESGEVLADRTVLITGDRIVEVARAADTRVPRGAEVIDGTGRYLIPGLWDMHSHVTMFGRPALSLYLANGVTGVRDMGAIHFAEARAWRDSIAAGRMLGPRMRIASPIVENPRWLAAVRQMIETAGVPWELHERFGPTSAEEAARWVDSVALLGADHIKVRNWPAVEIARALIDRAAEHGLPVVAHANRPFPTRGVATLEHGVWPPLADSAARGALWQELAAEGTEFVPTLVTWPIRLDSPDTLIARLDRGDLPGLEYVPAAARRSWREQLLGMAQEQAIDWEGMYRATLRDVAEMQRSGVTLMTGSDIGAPLLVPGFSLHDELELLVREAGLTPLEALRGATLSAARSMGLADAGAAAPGQLADLVLLDADPLADIGATRGIRAVIAAGRLLDRAALDRLLEEARATAAGEAAAAARDRPARHGYRRSNTGSGRTISALPALRGGPALRSGE